jgi:rfaE bifunctional protein nucleotidyltransferase chain/domain
MSEPRHRQATSTAVKCVSPDDLASAVSMMRQQFRRIVLTNGCFDLLHPGHVGYLEEAAAEGDCLIVAVNADRTVTQLKGPGRPVMSAPERARMLAALACVDLVVIFDESTPHAIIEIVRPDVLVKGGDYLVQEVVGRELVEATGGIVKTLGLTPGLSTSRVLERLSAGTPLADAA